MTNNNLLILLIYYRSSKIHEGLLIYSGGINIKSDYHIILHLK